MINVRDHLTSRITRSRLKLETKRSIRPLTVIVVAGMIGLLAWGYQVNEIGKYVLTPSREVQFALTDATAIVAGGSEVRFKGIPAGRITKVDQVDGRPVVTAKVYREFGPVYRDASAALRPNTALEDMYIDILDRGTKAAGPATAGRPLPAGRTDTAQQVEEVLQIFNPTTRGRLAVLLDAFGNGLDDRGEELEQTFVEVMPFVQTAARLTDQLAARGAETKRLIHNFRLLTDELGRRDTELRTLTQAGGTSLSSLAAASPHLDATLRELPPTVAAIRTSLRTVDGMLPRLDRALVDLDPVVDALPEGLGAVRRVSATAAPAVDALQQPVTRLVPFVRSLAPLSGRLSDAVDALRPQTGAVAHIVEDLGKCAFPAVNAFFEHTASLTKFDDARGAFPRGDAVFSAASSNIVADPNQRRLPGCMHGEPIGGTP